MSNKFGRMPKKGFEDFEEGEIVKGRVCGTFKIRHFDQLCGMPCVFLKEVHPVTHKEGPHPEIAFTEDMIRKLN